MATRVHIRDEAVCVSFHANSLGKGIDLSVLSLVIGNSRKLSKLDAPDMQDTAGEAGLVWFGLVWFGLVGFIAYQPQWVI